MKCENCGKNEVTFVYHSNINGKVEEKHLCGECAQQMGYMKKLADFADEVQCLKEKLSGLGCVLCADEPLKITVRAKEYGYTGYEMAEFLQSRGLVPEFADSDFLVLMLTPENSGTAELIYGAFASLDKRSPVDVPPPKFSLPEKVTSIREAVFAKSEILPVGDCIGRVLASVSVGCPPAVPIVVSGERIDSGAAECFRYYGITECSVINE